MVFLVVYAPFELNLFKKLENTHFDNEMNVWVMKSQMNWFPVFIIIRYLTLAQEDISQRYKFKNTFFGEKILQKGVCKTI